MHFRVRLKKKKKIFFKKKNPNNHVFNLEENLIVMIRDVKNKQGSKPVLSAIKFYCK